jgi:hypothetical protein
LQAECLTAFVLQHECRTQCSVCFLHYLYTFKQYP